MLDWTQTHELASNWCVVVVSCFFWQLNAFQVFLACWGPSGELAAYISWLICSTSYRMALMLQLAPLATNFRLKSQKGLLFFFFYYSNGVYVMFNNHDDNWKPEAKDPPECVLDRSTTDHLICAFLNKLCFYYYYYSLLVYKCSEFVRAKCCVAVWVHECVVCMHLYPSMVKGRMQVNTYPMLRRSSSLHAE